MKEAEPLSKHSFVVTKYIEGGSAPQKARNRSKVRPLMLPGMKKTEVKLCVRANTHDRADSCIIMNDSTLNE